MNKKNYALALVIASLTVIAGMVLLFDALGIAFQGAIDKWYLTLMMYLAGVAISFAIIKNAPLYYTIASVFVGVFTSMSLNKPFSVFWPLIPICISLGLMVTYLTSHRRLKFLKAGIILLILSLILLIGCITSCWQYIIPAELITAGLITIIYMSVKLSKENKEKAEEKDDYHVRPTKEINKKEDL